MRIWLLKIGEPVPTDSANVRLLRMGILADELVRRGHEVVWWTSTFDHRRKCQRSDSTQLVDLGDRYQLITLRSPGYRKNISLRRMIDHRVVAKRFSQLANSIDRPDVILSALPTLELGLAASEYAQLHDLPLVVDVRDMWPDVFERALPKLSTRLVRPLLQYFDRMATTVCGRATAITGHTEEFVAWGLEKANRPRNFQDQHFPFAYHQQPVEADLELEALEAWKQRGVLPSDGRTIVSFIGTLSHQFEMQPVISAARMLAGSTKVSFVICGDGENRKKWMHESKDCPNIIWPGWIETPKIQTLLKLSSLTLAPYRDTPDFAQSIPNKVIEYLASGTPVLTSLQQSSMHDLLSQHNCGESYANDAGQLASTIARLIDDPKLISEMSFNANCIFTEQFAAEKVYGRMIEHLEQISIQYGSSQAMKLAA